MQMRVVLPGEADAAVHLNVEFGVARIGGKGQRRRHRGDQPELRFVF